LALYCDAIRNQIKIVIPAKAGTQRLQVLKATRCVAGSLVFSAARFWVPACAGMTIFFVCGKRI
jgi:hypothetical protein